MMKDFDFERMLSGDKVVNDGGLIVAEYHVFDIEDYCIAVRFEGGNSVILYNKSGEPPNNYYRPLKMSTATVTRFEWRNVVIDSYGNKRMLIKPYVSEQEAIDAQEYLRKHMNSGNKFIKPVKLEWEE